MLVSPGGHAAVPLPDVKAPPRARVAELQELVLSSEQGRELEKLLSSVPTVEADALRHTRSRNLLVDIGLTERFMSSHMVVVYRRKFNFDNFPVLAQAIEGGERKNEGKGDGGNLWKALNLVRTWAGVYKVDINIPVTEAEAKETLKVQLAELSILTQNIYRSQWGGPPVVSAARTGAEQGREQK